ncbi:hypothetical protein F7734_49265 [Scytonema sp. UIC 10036]|uniref:hypothetical protein n=1 Tax=Scytonema sp. UIC 10036 TaxID=2304196 RepID=UPI0012DA90C4|nr:hypothetical protein [Scytonema sp. UIC 10036]MUG99846.1 hypothetical protein [Scytonema sp. UIC 10036]
MKEVYARIIHERALLMCRAEAEVLCQYAELGEEIYRMWVDTLDATAPDDYDLTDSIHELGTRYGINTQTVTNLFEVIRQLVLEYDALIDQI